MIYKFTITKRSAEKLPRYEWSISGEKGATSVWAQFVEGQLAFMGECYGGVEVHALVDPYPSLGSEDNPREPIDCHLVKGGKCYPDGSSLAFDKWQNMIIKDKDNPTRLNEIMWSECMSWYENHLGPRDKADDPS